MTEIKQLLVKAFQFLFYLTNCEKALLKISSFVLFFKDQFKTDNSYMAQAEALRSIGKCGNRSQISYLENKANMKSPRNVIKKASDWALKELKKDR